MDDDNLFDDDDALDYIIYEDVSNENENSRNNKSGCFAILIAFLIPVGLFKIWF